MREFERRSGGDRRRLSGAQRAAALLIVLGKEAAPKLLQHLNKDEVREIAKAAATLGVVDRGSLDRMIDEFSDEFVEGPEIVGTLSEAQQLAAGTLAPQEIAAFVETDKGPARSDVWQELGGLNDQRIVELVAGEPAWIAAPIVNRLGPERAAGLLEKLDNSARAMTIAHMLTSTAVAPVALSWLEEGVRMALSENLVNEHAGDAPKRVAEIVNRMEGAFVDEVLSHLSEVAPESAAIVRSQVFKFDELTILSHEDRLKLFDGLPTERVVLALKGATPDLIEAALGSLGARARRLVETELAGDGAAPRREVQAARRMIVETVLRLSAAGAIALPTSASLQG